MCRMNWIGWLEGKLRERRLRTAAGEALCPTCRGTFVKGDGVSTLGVPACSAGCAQVYNESVAW